MRLRFASLVVFGTAVLVLASCGQPAPTATPTLPQATSITCDGKSDTTAALQTAVNEGGTVSIPAGRCLLTARIKVRKAVTIEGAGQQETFLIQHGRHNIFEITAAGVTVENLNLDTATYNTSTAPVLHQPDPGVLFSNVSDTHVINVTGETGSGYGMRFVGPSPCVSDVNGGQVISNVSMTTTGTGGFAAVDVSCQHQATLTNVTIHGGILAFFHDQDITLNGEIFAGGPRAIRCAHPWYITGPASNITIENVVSSSGHGVVKQPASGITVTNQTVTGSGC
jgi:hypothetical protein